MVQLSGALLKSPAALHNSSTALAQRALTNTPCGGVSGRHPYLQTLLWHLAYHLMPWTTSMNQTSQPVQQLMSVQCQAEWTCCLLMAPTQHKQQLPTCLLLPHRVSFASCTNAKHMLHQPDLQSWCRSSNEQTLLCNCTTQSVLCGTH